MTNNSSALFVKGPRPSLLIWARKQAAYELDDVAKSLNVPLGTIRAWEAGDEHPNIETIRRLSLFYDVPFSYFFLDHPPQEIPLQDYRGVAVEKRASLSREAQLAFREFRRLHRLAKNLQKITASDISLNIGNVYPNEDPEEVAKREAKRLGVTRDLRKTWLTNEAAYRARREILEGLGIYVFSLRIPSLECRGAAMIEKPNAAAILVNQNDAPTGRSFSLFHEYYHLMLKSDKELLICDQFPGETETFANRFAASILLPEDEFLELLREKRRHHYDKWWPDATLSDLAHEFAVSRDVIAIRLENLGLAPPGFYGRKREHWDKVFRGGGGFGRGGKGKKQYAEEKLGHHFFDLTLQAVAEKVLHPFDAALYIGEVRGGKKPWLVKAKDIESWIEQQDRL